MLQGISQPLNRLGSNFPNGRVNLELPSPGFLAPSFEATGCLRERRREAVLDWPPGLMRSAVAVCG